MMLAFESFRPVVSSSTGSGFQPYTVDVETHYEYR